MALSAESGRIMGFFVLVASEAGFPCGDLPRMGSVTAAAREFDVFALLVQPPKVAVARSTIDHGLALRLLKVTCLAAH